MADKVSKVVSITALAEAVRHPYPTGIDNLFLRGDIDAKAIADMKEGMTVEETVKYLLQHFMTPSPTDNNMRFDSSDEAVAALGPIGQQAILGEYMLCMSTYLGKLQVSRLGT